jgi:hypothetical protein
MRGSGDAASATLNSKNLEEVIKWQQSTLRSVLGKPLDEIPQTWVMYKEVPGYWQKGLDVSEDVTLLWTDDNRGNIRRIPTAKETKRRGGAGMYYHFDYVGVPRSYKWINTIQLQKTWEQMHLAYGRDVRNIWIVNVGDLKAMVRHSCSLWGVLLHFFNFFYSPFLFLLFHFLFYKKWDEFPG